MPNDLLTLSILSRIFIYLLQFIANHLIPDHNAGVFQSPMDENVIPTIADRLVEWSLGGFRRWDAEYFLHIAEYGYTYENTLAFYPLYPFFINILANIVKFVVPMSNRSSILLIAILINFIMFILSSKRLYQLTVRIFASNRIAHVSVILFCFNPATIFFVAPYSESVFSFLSFSVMYYGYRRKYIQLTLFLILSCLCRANGVINLGFLFFYSAREIIIGPKRLKHLAKTFMTLFIVLLTLSILWFHQYRLFCQENPAIKHASLILDHAVRENFILAGKQSNSSWCFNRPPIAYSYVQKEYWNVGLFRYYEYKQIPNFVLSFPILFLFLTNCCSYFRNNFNSIITFKVILHPYWTSNDQLFVFIVHAFFLTIFSICFVHIQITTRLLASSSPCLYWFGSNLLTSWPDKYPRNIPPVIHSIQEILSNLWISRRFTEAKLYVYWSLGYVIIGTILFCNSLPWT